MSLHDSYLIIILCWLISLATLFVSLRTARNATVNAPWFRAATAVGGGVLGALVSAVAGLVYAVPGVLIVLAFGANRLLREENGDYGPHVTSEQALEAHLTQLFGDFERDMQRPCTSEPGGRPEHLHRKELMRHSLPGGRRNHPSSGRKEAA